MSLITYLIAGILRVFHFTTNCVISISPILLPRLNRTQPRPHAWLRRIDVKIDRFLQFGNCRTVSLKKTIVVIGTASDLGASRRHHAAVAACHIIFAGIFSNII